MGRQTLGNKIIELHLSWKVCSCKLIWSPGSAPPGRWWVGACRGWCSGRAKCQGSQLSWSPPPDRGGSERWGCTLSVSRSRVTSGRGGSLISFGLNQRGSFRSHQRSGYELWRCLSALWIFCKILCMRPPTAGAYTLWGGGAVVWAWCHPRRLPRSQTDTRHGETRDNIAVHYPAV